MFAKYVFLLLTSFSLAATATAIGSAASVATGLQQTAPSQTATGQANAAQELAQVSLVHAFQGGQWQRDALGKFLGQVVKSFDDYVYYQAGIAVKWDENGRAFGVLAEPGFKGEIVPGITVQTSQQEILRKLGTPAFTEQEYGLIGYSYQDYYLFVTFAEQKAKAFSLYRRDRVPDTRALVDMAQHLQAYGEKLAEPAASGPFSIFAAWGQPDFTYHLHGIGTYAWEYPSRGIAYDGAPEEATLTIYSNFPAKDALPALAKLPYVSISPEDALFVAEKQRIEQEKANLLQAKSEGIFAPDRKTVAVIDSEVLYSSASIRFYDPNDKPVAQLFPGHYVNKAVWLDNNWIYYETMMGAGVYHVPTQKATVILSWDEQQAAPITMFDVNETHLDLAKKEIAFVSADSRTYTVQYQLAGERVFLAWKK
ncbi:hypothetical protein [Brevibacillus agri]|uniref:hypothetical protein n=1 Tax=Brevibacillus agri TaxID=51101 RepID=UPI0030F3BFC8